MNLLKYLFLVILGLAGCQIYGDFKGLTSYRYEVDPHMESLSSQVDFNCDQAYATNQRFSIINGLQLKQCISSNQQTLLYVWRPNCTTPACIDLNLLQAECKRMNITLYVVAEYYDLKQFTIRYNLEKPIIGIDTYHYQTNFTSKYVKLFLRDVLDYKKSKKLNASFYYFYLDQLLYEATTFELILAKLHER
jgi:hypothetical protein